jgi:hypothetical protein
LPLCDSRKTGHQLLTAVMEITDHTLKKIGRGIFPFELPDENEA